MRLGGIQWSFALERSIWTSSQEFCRRFSFGFAWDLYVFIPRASFCSFVCRFHTSFLLFDVFLSFSLLFYCWPYEEGLVVPFFKATPNLRLQDMARGDPKNGWLASWGDWPAIWVKKRVPKKASWYKGKIDQNLRSLRVFFLTHMIHRAKSEWEKLGLWRAPATLFGSQQTQATYQLQPTLTDAGAMPGSMPRRLRMPVLHGPVDGWFFVGFRLVFLRGLNGFSKGL